MESRHDDQVMDATEVVSTSTSSMEMGASSEVMDNPAIREKSTPSPSSDSAILRPSDEDEFEDDEESENFLNSDEIRNESVPGTSGQQKPIYFYFRMRSINIIEKGTKNSSKDGYYKCHICDRPYLQKFSLKRHFVRSHIDPKYLSPADLHNCKITKGEGKAEDGIGERKSSAGRKKYKDDNALYVDNNKTTILKGLYRCNICHGVQFDLEADLKSHYLQHANENKPAEFPCNLCKEVFPNKIALSKHVSSHSQPLRCSICNLDFPIKADFVAHMSTHGSKTQCKYCGKCFSTAANRKRHEGLHEGGQGFTCKHCLQVFTDSNILEVHIKKKHSKNPLTCQLCPKTGRPEVFNSQVQLSAHIAAVHPNAPRKRKDNAIPKARPSASSLSSPPKAICPVCGKAFQDIRAMLTHKALDHKKKGLHSNLPHKNSPLRRPSIAKEKSYMGSQSSSSEKADVQDSKTQGKKKKVLRRRPTYKRKAKQPIKSKVMRRKIALSKKELALKEKQEEREFYSNLAQNIANNLLHHLDGQANQLRIKNYTFNDESEEQRADQFNIPWSAFNFPKDFDVDQALEKRGREIKVRTPEEQCLLATGLRKVVPSPTEIAAALSSPENAESSRMTHTEDNGPLNAETSLNTTGLQRPIEIDTLLDVEEINERPKGLKTWEISDRQDFEINHQLKRSMPVNQRKVSPLTVDEKLDMIYYDEQTVLICTVCQERFSSDDHFDEHCINNHPNIEVSSLKIVSDKASPPVIPYDLSRPLCPNSSTGALFSYSVPPAQPSRWTCTKCKSVFSSASDLHVHIVSCGGETFSSPSRRKRFKLKRIKHTMKHRIDLSVNRIIIKKKGSKESKTRPLTKAGTKIGKDFFSTKKYKTAKTVVSSRGASVFFCDYCKTSFPTRDKRQEHYNVCPVFYKGIESQKSSKVTHVVTKQTLAKKNLKMRIVTVHPDQVDRIDSQNKVASQKNPVAPEVVNKAVGAKPIPAKTAPVINGAVGVIPIPAKTVPVGQKNPVAPAVINGAVGAIPLPAKTVPGRQNSLNSAMDLSVKSGSSIATLPATPLDTLQQMCQSMECGTSNISSQATVHHTNPKNTSALNGNAQLHGKDVTKPEPKKHSTPLLKIKEVVKEIKLAKSASNHKKASSQNFFTCLQKLGTSTKSSSVGLLSSNTPAHITPSINQQTLVKNSPNVSQETPVTNQDADSSRRKRKLEIPVKKIKWVGNVADANLIPELNTSSTMKEKGKQSDLSVAVVSLGKDGVVPKDMPELLTSKEKGSTTEKDLSSSSHFSKEKDGANQELSKSLPLNDSVKPKDLSKLSISKGKVSAQDKCLDKSLVPNEKEGAKQALSKPLALNDSFNQNDMSKSTASKDKYSLNDKSLTKSLVSNEKDSMKKNDLSNSLVSKENDVAKQVNLTNVLASTGKDLAKQVHLTQVLVLKEKDAVKQVNLIKVLASKEKDAAKQVNLTKVPASKEKDAAKQMNLTKVFASKEKEAGKVKQIDLPNSLVPKKDSMKEVNLSKSLGRNENNVAQQKNMSKSSVLKEKEVSKSLIPNEKDSIPNINHVIKQKDLPKLPALKEVYEKEKNLPKSHAPKENNIIKQKNATKLIVSKVVLPFSNSLEEREDNIKQVDSLVSDRPIDESSSTVTPDMAKSVNQVKSVTPGAKHIKDKVDQVEKLNILAKKDVDNKVAKDSVACNSIPNTAIVERPAELIFSTGEGDKELDSSGRESPTLANLVSSVTQNIEGFDDQDDERFVLPSPFLPSMNCDSMTKESSNGSLSFQIVIPRNENQSGSFLNGVGLPSDSFGPFPIMNSTVGNVLQELDKSKNFTTNETHISNQNAVITVSNPHHVDPSLKVSSPLTLCSITKQINPPLGKEVFGKKHQTSMDKNQANPLVPDGTSSPSLTLPTCPKDLLDKDPKDAASSNISSIKNSVAIGKNLSGDVSVSLKTSNSLPSTTDDNSSKSKGLSSKRKGQESNAFSNKIICIETSNVTAQLQSETDIQRADSSQREGQDQTAKPDEPSAKSAQLRAFRVLKSISTEKSSSQKENTSPTDFAEKMKEKFRKSFGSGSTSTLAAISIAASDAAALNRTESIANSTTPTNDTLVDNNAEQPDSSVKEESEPNEEDSGRGQKEFEKHTCPYCFLEFAYLSNFRRHLRACQNKGSEEVVPVPSTSTGVTRLQHLPKKDEVEGSMLHLLRHQSRQSQMIKEVNKDPETIVSPDLKFRKFVCEDCHKIYLSLFKLMQHRLKDHKMGSDAKAMMSAHQQVLEAGEEAFQGDWDPEPNVCVMENDGDMMNAMLDHSYSEGLECQEEVPEEQIGMQLAQTESNSNSQEERELGEVIEHKEGEIDQDLVNSPEPENRVDVFEPSRDTIAPEAEGSVASEADAEYAIASGADTEDSIAPDQDTEDSVAPKQDAEDSIAPEQDAEDSVAPEQDAEDSVAPEQDAEDSVAPDQDAEDSTAPEQVEDSIADQDAEISIASAPNAEDSIASEADAEDSIASEANADDSIAPGSNMEDKTLIEQPLTKEDDAVLPNKYKELLDPSFLVLPAFGKGRGRKKKDATETDGNVKEQEALTIMPQSKKNKGRMKGRGKAKFTASKIKGRSKAKFTTLNMKTKKEFKKLGPKRRGLKASKPPSNSIVDSAPITSVQNAVPSKGRRGRKPRELKKLELEEKKDSKAQENKREDVPMSENVLEKDHVLTVMKNVPQSASTSVSRRGKRMPPKTNLITNLNVPKCKKVKFNDDELSAFASPLMDSHSTISFSSDLSIVKEKANPSKTLPNPNSGSVKVIKLKSETILSNVDSSTKASNTKGNRLRRGAGNDNAVDSAKKSAKQPAFLIDYYKIESSPPTSPINNKMNIKAIPKSICDIQSLRSPAVVGRKPPSIRMVTIVTDEDSEVDDLPDTRQEAQRKKVCPICKKRFSGALLRNRHMQLQHPRKNNRGDAEVVADQEEKQGRSSQRQCTKPVPAVKRRNQKTPQSSDPKRRRL